MKKIRGVLTILAAVVLTGVSAQNQAVSVGILPFSSSAAKASSSSVVSDLTSSLSSYAFIRLIERARMDEMAKEIELGMSGLVDEKTAVKQGKVMGLEIMVLGSISPSGVSARAVHVESGRIIASSSAPSSSQNDMRTLGKNLAYDIETFLARENVKHLRNDSPDITLKFWTAKKSGAAVQQGSKLKIGDSIVFNAQSSKNGYLTIVDVQPGGDVVVLYPNDFAKDNAIAANTLYSIPSASDNFEITVTEPAGTDTVVAFFTERKADWLDRNKLEGSGFKTVKIAERYFTTRGFSVVATNLKRNEWESSSLEVDVVK